MPDCGHPCSTEIKWFVFLTDSMMVSKSKGLRLRKLITSASMPIELSSLAASRQVWTARENDTRVTCLPADNDSMFKWNVSEAWNGRVHLLFRFWPFQLEQANPWTLLRRKLRKKFRTWFRFLDRRRDQGHEWRISTVPWHLQLRKVLQPIFKIENCC